MCVHRMLTKCNVTVRTFDEAVTAGTKSVIKSVPDATEATVAGASFHRQAVLDVNSRAVRETRESMELTEDFKIIGFKRPEGSDIGRYTLASKSAKISATLICRKTGHSSQSKYSTSGMPVLRRLQLA